jgi:putative aldouronate transport system permease protein
MPAKKRKGFLYDVWRWRAFFVLMLPAIVVLLINNYIPMLGAVIAFKNIKYSYPGFIRNLIESPWVGLRNFEFLFKSGSSWLITRNTLLYNFAFMILGTVLAVFFAIMINEVTNKKVAKVYQNIIWRFEEYSGKEEKVVELRYGNRRNHKPVIQRDNRGDSPLEGHRSY